MCLCLLYYSLFETLPTFRASTNLFPAVPSSAPFMLQNVGTPFFVGQNINIYF